MPKQLILIACMAALVLFSCNGGGGGGSDDDSSGGGVQAGSISISALDIQRIFLAETAGQYFMEKGEVVPGASLESVALGNPCMQETKEGSRFALELNGCRYASLALAGSAEITPIQEEGMEDLLPDTCSPTEGALRILGLQAELNLSVTLEDQSTVQTEADWRLLFLAEAERTEAVWTLAGSLALPGFQLETGEELHLTGNVCFRGAEDLASGESRTDFRDAPGGELLATLLILPKDALFHDFRILNAAGVEVATGSIDRQTGAANFSP